LRKKVLLLIIAVFGIIILSSSDTEASCATTTCYPHQGSWVLCSPDNYPNVPGCCHATTSPITCCCQQGTISGDRYTRYEVDRNNISYTCTGISDNCSSRCSGLGGVRSWTWCNGQWICGTCEPVCTSCTPPACPAGSAESPANEFSFTTSCDRGAGCNPRYNYRTCYWQRQNLCSGATTSQSWLKTGQSTTITGNANTNVNEFYYIFFNRENQVGGIPQIICSTTRITGWAENQGTCPSGSYQLIRVNRYASARSSDSQVVPANNMFIVDANWGNRVVRNAQVNVYFRIDGRPLSTPEVPCVVQQYHCFPLCEPQCGPTYSDSNRGQGSVQVSCSNTPSQCGTESKTCYIWRCSDCDLPNCPTPLTNTGHNNYVLSNFRSCTAPNPCGGASRYGHCYEVTSPQPIVSLSIVPDQANQYNFSSNTHSGRRILERTLNDPISMVATFTDVNGANDIEALAVWFRSTNQSGQVATPLWIDENVNPGQPPSSPANNSWGFMMRRESGVWRPYIPSYPAGGTPKWVRAVISNNTFVIPGPNGIQMIRITIDSSITQSGNTVTMPFKVGFTFNPGTNEEVAQTGYNVYLMGRDIFSFTPFDNYNFSVAGYWEPGQLRYRPNAQLYARQWTFSGWIWNLDFVEPTITNISTSNPSGNSFTLNFSVQDNQRVYAVVGNIYASPSMENPQEISFSGGGGLQVNSPYQLVYETDSTVVGGLFPNEWAFGRFNINSANYSGSINIDVGNNTSGSLIIHLTVFDYAGNMNSSYTTFDLGNWMITHGGLAYSSEGMDFEIKDLPESAWNANNRFFKVRNQLGLFPHQIDITTELWGDNRATGTLQAPDKHLLHSSYHIKPYAENTITNYYEEFLLAYRKRSVIGVDEVNLESPNISGNMVGGLCNVTDTRNPCVFIRKGDLNITSALNCNGRGLFFVEGNLLINGDIVEGPNPNRDACIFIVKGNVTFSDGTQANQGNNGIGFDEYNAYILAEGTVTLLPDSRSGNQIRDGILIKGGLHSLGGLTWQRTLRLADRFVVPAVVIKHHSKYGVLSSLLFGQQVDVLKTEVGYKPY
jgi:hypothetical protein